MRFLHSIVQGVFFCTNFIRQFPDHLNDVRVKRFLEFSSQYLWNGRRYGPGYYELLYNGNRIGLQLVPLSMTLNDLKRL